MGYARQTLLLLINGGEWTDATAIPLSTTGVPLLRLIIKTPPALQTVSRIHAVNKVAGKRKRFLACMLVTPYPGNR